VLRYPPRSLAYSKNGSLPVSRFGERRFRATLVASLSVGLVLAACGASGASPTATSPPTTGTGASPVPEPLTFESIYGGTAESVSLATLTADIQRSLTASTIVPKTIIPNLVPNATQDLSAYEHQASDSAALSARAACFGLVLNYYAAYKLSFASPSYNGTDLLYRVARETYWYCVSPQGAYSASTGFKGQLQVAWSRGVDVITP
jgi:hypothetical protein